ncbi:hypothetical protein SMC26_11870 [Actinomadura fulvescens]|uniref:Uncharacterized protein n=1 Tax=Actinomadura fulvescens TaxID=46160 RepID=A0ABN3PHA3_9ACTN
MDRGGQLLAHSSVEGGSEQLLEALLRLTGITSDNRRCVQAYVRDVAHDLLTRGDRPPSTPSPDPQAPPDPDDPWASTPPRDGAAFTDQPPF